MTKLIKYLLLNLPLFINFTLFSHLQGRNGINQLNNNPSNSTYTIKKTIHQVKIDGKIEETAWKEATRIHLPYEYLPADNVSAPVETAFFITFNETNLYLAFLCKDPDPSQIRAHLMDRDAMETFDQDDYVSVMIDFFNDERRAFQFLVNPLGVQADAIFSEMEGFQDFSWDAIWDSRGKITEFGWVAEISIPFNQLRFPSPTRVQTWGISAERSYPRNVRHQMSSHKRERDISSLLSQFNKVTGFQGMKTGLNLEFDPTFTTSRTDTRYEFPNGNMETGKIKTEPGISMRWGITPNLILNTALNPDFSQVEADVQQLEINRRYAVRYPEKRPFFLEGADIFVTPIEAVFTRTVADPDAGIKFTGKSGRYAFGVFGIYDKLNNLLIPSNEGSISTAVDQDVKGGVFRLRRDMGRGSTLGITYTGREGVDYYNHVADLDGYFRLSRNKTLSLQMLGSRTNYDPGVTTNFTQKQGELRGQAISFQFSHLGRNWSYYATYQDLSPDFRADFGYIPRVDVRSGQIGLSRNFWGKQDSWYDLITVGGYGGAIYDYQGNRTDNDIHVYAAYQGPLQTNFSIISALKQEIYSETRYDLIQSMVQLDIKPMGGLRLYMMTHFGDMVDYSNLRLAWHMILNPVVDFSLGKHINVNLRHRYMRLSRQKNEIFTANLSQVKLIYNFSVRAFLRAIIQYQDIENNPEMFINPISTENKTVFTQFLFSYKLNPQTMLFVGYSDNALGLTGIDITHTNRTFFVKMGYAWLR